MLKWILLTPWVSPHQIPLARQIAISLGEENFRYWYLEPPPENHKVWGWDKLITEPWFYLGVLEDKTLQDADVVMSGMRLLDLFDARLKKDRKTLYCSERWFKPPLGFLRILAPSYFKMVWRFVKCFKSDVFTYYPQGIHAARDMVRLVRFLNGDLRYLFRAPKVAFESQPGGVIIPLKEAVKAGVLSKAEIAFGKKYGFVQIPREHWGKLEPQQVYAKMRLWGYFVEPGKKTTEYTEYTEGGCAQDCQCEINHEIHEKHEKGATAQTRNSEPRTRNCREGASRLRVLWVGRMLNWKRVDTLVKACVSDALKDKVELHLYGHGPEEEKLKRLANRGNNVFFHDFVPVAQVRDLMRAHDVYVLPSDGGEGWGAVVSEALEEGMKVLGTIEAGASATILPPSHLFKSGDVNRLKQLLSVPLPRINGYEEWLSESLDAKVADVFLKLR